MRNGYVRIKINQQTWAAHRLAWTLVHGPIPRGMWVLHHCDVRNCINVDHLFLGTSQDNIDDKMQKGRWRGNGFKEWTHCKAGHEYTPENTYINKASGQRVCRACTARWQREYLARKRQTN